MEKFRIELNGMKIGGTIELGVYTFTKIEKYKFITQYGEIYSTVEVLDFM